MKKSKNKPCKFKLGDFVLCTSNRKIVDELWQKMHPQGLFGKVIKIDDRWSKGAFLGNMITIRTYPKRYRYHYKRMEKDLKQAF